MYGAQNIAGNSTENKRFSKGFVSPFRERFFPELANVSLPSLIMFRLSFDADKNATTFDELDPLEYCVNEVLLILIQLLDVLRAYSRNTISRLKHRIVLELNCVPQKTK